MAIQFDLNDPNLENALTAYYAPPLPVAPTQAGSTNPAVFRTPEYIEKLNQQQFQEFMVTVPNLAMWNTYKFQLHNYFANKSFQNQPYTTPPPIMTTGYLTLDPAKFHEVWLKWVPGTDFTDYSFVSNLPVAPTPTFTFSANKQNTDPNAPPVGDYDGNGIWLPGPNDSTIQAGKTWTDAVPGRPTSGKTFLKFVYSTPFTGGQKSYYLEVDQPQTPPVQQNYQ